MYIIVVYNTKDECFPIVEYIFDPKHVTICICIIYSLKLIHYMYVIGDVYCFLLWPSSVSATPRK